MAVILSTGTLLPLAAQASEVVKLARLVITGKRLGAPMASRSGGPSGPRPQIVSQQSDDEASPDGRRGVFRPI
ncbi:hypothetical protein [Roseateles koreensis]|uniref:Uncharacterized protein n=1 Tax=Roseateles koreensis TaxID=2987526 RepID=A0ABT5KL62_9BURK|nr:hypothetical protein [Roseateles koreensis]MDC8783601.1 hypothetical protein [Roseateles koreensis]